ncbi:MAG: NAD-dependent epimerase/dehydratase family protein [Rhodospirillales bacterium]
MKIVVTGALGHIGSRLIRELQHHVVKGPEPIDIVMVDDLSTQRYASLFDLPGGARYRFIEGDVTKMDLEPVLDGAHAVIHLAAITDATRSFERKEETEENNYTGTLRVAKAAARHGVRMIYPSSTSVYGTQKDLVDENCGPEDLKPQSPYAETKLREEALLAQLAGERNLKQVTLRFGTIFGTSPGMRFHTAVNKFCWQAVMGEPLTVWRTALDQKRPYLDLGDAVRAVGHFITKDLFDGGIYNVLTHNATVREVVEAIRAQVPHLAVTQVETRIMNQLSYEVACAKLKATGFEARGDMRDAIAATVRLLQRAGTAKA